MTGSSSSSNSPEYFAWLTSPQVQRAIESVLRREGLRGPDLEDARQLVWEEALAVAQPPVNVGECIRLVEKIAAFRARNAIRRRRLEAKHMDGDTRERDGDGDERPDRFVAAASPLDRSWDAGEAIDTQRRAEVFRRAVASGEITERQVTILEREMDGVPQAEIARELGVSHQTVRHELAAARRTARARWMAFGALTLLVVGFLLWHLRDRDRVAHLAPDDVPPVLHEPPPVSPKQLAERDRAEAFQDCAAKNWYACRLKLDAAKNLDPAGDTAPRVQEARDAMEKALRQQMERRPIDEKKTP